MRNRIRSCAYLLVLVMLLSMLSFSTAATEVETPKIYTADAQTEIFQALDVLSRELEARHILVYDSDHDTLLYSKTVEGGKLYPASITKLYSICVALEVLSPDEVITAGDELSLVQPGSSVAYIGKGNQLTVSMIVEAMLLPSGNDAAMVLAAAAGRRIAGDETLPAEEAVQAFVTRMNDRAKELGFQKSHFANPDGFHIGSHYTCISDMTTIARMALENDTITAYMGLAAADETFVSGHAIHWKNTNHLLDPEDKYYQSEAIGMKTGYTRPAGYSLMSAFRHGNRTLVIGVFGNPTSDGRWEDIISIWETCKEHMRKTVQR